MACGYAMYTDKLGFCFATAGPGAFNLFSGLAVAMSDSYPVLAVSGFASLDWRGKGSLNETSGVNRTPDSQKMFEATTKKSFLLTDIVDTCDVLEEAVNLAFEGRPGPVHIHVPENLTHHGVEVQNYHDIRLDVAPVVPDPARVEEIASVLADAIAQAARRSWRSSASGRSAAAPACRGQAAHRAVPDPAAHHAGRQGHRVRRAPALGRASSATAVTPAPGRPSARPTSCSASATRSTSTPRSTTATTCSRARRSSTSTSRKTRSTRPTRPTTRSSPTPARGRRARRRARAEGRRRSPRPRSTARTTRPGTSCT